MNDKLKSLREKLDNAKIQMKKCSDAMEEADKKLVEALTAMDGVQFDVGMMEKELNG